MSTTFGSAVRVFLKTLSEKHIPQVFLVEGLSISLADIQNPDYVISRDQYLALSERFAQLLAEYKDNSIDLAQYMDAGHWEALLGSLPLSVSVADLDGTLVFANRSISGRSREEVIGRTVYDFTPLEDHPVIREAVQTLAETGESCRIETLSGLPDGRIICLETYLSPIFGDNIVIGFLSVTSDITERKRSEAELHKRALQLQIVAEVSAQIKSTLNLHQLIQNICDLTKQHFGLYHAHIYLLDVGSGNLVIEAGAGEVGRQITDSKRTFQLDEGEKGLVVLAAQTGEIVISNDVEHDPHFKWNPFLPDTRSEMAIPIVLDSRLLGILDFQSDKTSFFTDDDRAVQQTLADQIAVAIRNARLYSSIRNQGEISRILRDIALILTSSHDRKTILENTLKETAQVLPFSAAGVWLQDDADEEVMRIVAWVGYEPFGVSESIRRLRLRVDSTPLMAEMQREKGVIVIPDTREDDRWGTIPGYEWIRSWAAAPIISRGNLVGRLTLDHVQPETYNPDHISILEVLSREISLAVDNASLFESERAQREMAETMRDIGLVLTSSLDQGDILQLVLAQVARVLPYSAAGVWLDDGTGVFNVAAHFGYDAFDAEDHIQNLRFFAGDAHFFLNKDEAFIISDTHQSDQWTIVEGFDWIRSWASAPIVVRGQLIGKVSLDHAQPGFYNTRQHKSLLESLTTQVSIAVGNARLFEAERQRRQEIEALQRGNISLTASLELTEVLDAILGAAFDLSPARDANVFLYENDTLIFGAGMNYHHQRFDKPIAIPRPDGLTYSVAQTGENIIVNDMDSHPLFKDYRPAPFNQLGAIIGIALKIGSRVVGVMNLAFDSPAHPGTFDTSSLQLLANQASIAIENARLYKAVQDHAAQLESRVEERTAELESERAQLQTILDSMAEGVIYDEGLEIKYINRQLSEMIGSDLHHIHQYEELVRFMVPSLVDAEKIISRAYRIPRQAESWQQDVRLRRSDGSEFDASVVCASVKDADEMISGAVTIVREIGQEKALQIQRERFISHASHELRTPLTNLQTRLYLLQRRPERLQEHLRVIESVAEQMTNLVEDLLDVSRFKRGVIEMRSQAVVLQDIILRVTDIQRAESDRKGISLLTELPETPVVAEVDVRRMEQVFTNLITNAINYTEEGGSITVTLTSELDHSAVITVQDTGVGIAPHLLGQVFQPFFRASEGMAVGTGLGLSITREIVDAHHGTLSVDSVKGQGSAFTVTLPLKGR